jgi:hypothetical protein
MEIKTAYPIIIDGETIDPNDYYSNAAGTSQPEAYTSGDLNIQTSYPVVLDGKDVSPKDYYSNLTDPNMQEQVAMRQKGWFWDKTKGTWQKISNNPGAQFALEKIAEYMKMKQSGGFGGGGFTAGGGTGEGTKDTLPDATLTDKTPEPMTMTTKIIIGVGIAAVLGFVGYAIFASKK